MLWKKNNVQHTNQISYILVLLTWDPHLSHSSTNMLPWSSESRFLGKPDRLCRPSTFCVITYLTIPEAKNKNNNHENQHNQFVEKKSMKKNEHFWNNRYLPALSKATSAIWVSVGRALSKVTLTLGFSPFCSRVQTPKNKNCMYNTMPRYAYQVCMKHNKIKL